LKALNKSNKVVGRNRTWYSRVYYTHIQYTSTSYVESQRSLFQSLQYLHTVCTNHLR